MCEITQLKKRSFLSVTPLYMAKKNTKRDLARDYYVSMGNSQKEIAEKLGVSENSVSTWKRAEGWDALRAAQVSQPKSIIAELQQNILRISKQANEEDRAITSAEADQISKISATIDKLEKQTTLRVVIAVMEDFMAHLAEVDRDLTKQVAGHQNDFVIERARLYGHI